MIPLNPHLRATEAPPVMEARRWLDGATCPPGRPLLNVSQAAPVAPPPAPLRAAMAQMIETDPGAHLYGPVLGLPELRAEVSARWQALYGGEIGDTRVAVTPGCNAAFAAAMATLAGPGDEVLLPTPWYFNHKMWLDMSGVRAVPLPTGDALMPDPETAAALIGPRTRALVLVTPNNPAGVEYPPDLIAALGRLARERRIALVLDETYRDFRRRDGPPHGLFADPDWDETLVQLYSFSKAYRLTGHRVGALVASSARLAEAEKFLDTVIICPPALGQMAALWGLRHLGDWLAGERRTILARRRAMERALGALPGWDCRGAGAYFAYARHPSPRPSEEFARALVGEAGILALPGTMFRPAGDADGAREMRFAFANIDEDEIAALGGRLGAIG